MSPYLGRWKIKEGKMRIKLFETGLYKIPLLVPLSDSTHGEMPFFELITVRIKDEDGIEGVGYTYSVGVGGRAIYSLVEYDLKPILLNEDSTRIEHIWWKMWWRLHFSGRGGHASFAIAAVDIALWDMAGKRGRLPLWRLLGGNSSRVKVYAGGVDLYFSIEQLKDQAHRFLSNGYRAIKMKVGRPRLSEDVARVKAIRELIGPDIPLMVDVNMGWSVEQAIQATKAFAEFDVFWLEEPIIPDDLAGHIKIMREGVLPIATGENFHTLYEFQNFITAGAVSFPEPDLATCGGISVWIKVARLAEAHNLPVTSHGVHDLHVHTLAAVSNASYLEGHGFGLDKYIQTPLVIENGEAIAPERPGHGVELDWEKLQFHKIL
jgi:L-alanine-DL-glutamate epimerase-like enolase superfamily enzyme